MEELLYGAFTGSRLLPELNALIVDVCPDRVSRIIEIRGNALVCATDDVSETKPFVFITLPGFPPEQIGVSLVLRIPDASAELDTGTIVRRCRPPVVLRASHEGVCGYWYGHSSTITEAESRIQAFIAECGPDRSLVH